MSTPADWRALADRLNLEADDDVRAMRRDVAVRRDQFVDVRDLDRWGQIMDDAAAALREAAAIVERTQD